MNAQTALLPLWSKPQEAVLASHFFWNSGTEMQKSQQGLLQSLLYDIFRQCPDRIKKVCINRWTGDADDEDAQESWYDDELREVLVSIAGMENLPTKFCIFIDGLDEYDGSHFELCEAIQDLARSTHIKLCVSSRPWNIFEEAFAKSSARLSIHEQTRGDIKKFTEDRLQSHPSWDHVAFDPVQSQWLIEEITERAHMASSSGFFLSSNYFERA